MKNNRLVGEVRTTAEKNNLFEILRLLIILVSPLLLATVCSFSFLDYNAIYFNPFFCVLTISSLISIIGVLTNKERFTIKVIYKVLLIVLTVYTFIGILFLIYLEYNPQYIPENG